VPLYIRSFWASVTIGYAERMSPPSVHSSLRRGTWAVCIVATILTAAPRRAHHRARYPEGPAHGFVELSDLFGVTIAHGELVQWLENASW
jgi:hypothetical protein